MSIGPLVGEIWSTEAKWHTNGAHRQERAKFMCQEEQEGTMANRYQTDISAKS